MCREKTSTPPISESGQRSSILADMSHDAKPNRKGNTALSRNLSCSIDGAAPSRARASSCSGSFAESSGTPSIHQARRRSCSGVYSPAQISKQLASHNGEEDDRMTRFRPPLPSCPVTSGSKVPRLFSPLTPPLSPSRPSTPPRNRASSADDGSRLRRPNPLELRVPSLGPATPTRMPSQSLVSALQSYLTPSPVSKQSLHARLRSPCSELENVPISVAQNANSNWRPYMEDGHRVVDPLPIGKSSITKSIDAKWAYFAVYDGHGGRQAVDWLEEHLHHLVADELQNVRITKSGHPEDSCVIAALTNAFKHVDGQLAALGAWKYGSTATVALIHTSFAGSMVYLANVGDSHAGLVGTSRTRIISVDHKASNPVEAARVQDAGGLVYRKRVGGVLSVSRALGDHQLKGEGGGVSCEPDVFIFRVDDYCRALVLASDGLWDVLSVEDVQHIVQGSIEKAIEQNTKQTQVQDGLSNEAAQALVDAALKEGTRDNVIALVAFL